MGHRRTNQKKAGQRRGRIILLAVLAVALIGVLAVGAVVFLSGDEDGTVSSPQSASDGSSETREELDVSTPQDALESYFTRIEEADYEGMYEMLDSVTREEVSEEDFIERSRNIYEGIGASDFTLNMSSDTVKTSVGEDGDRSGQSVVYTVNLNTIAGPLTYDNTTVFVKEKREWKLVWSDEVIFPDLEATDTIRISTESADRGSIYDRNGELLAGTGTATSVGLVPGKMEEESAARLAKELGISEESIESKLSASWVTDDSLVPVTTVEKIGDGSEEEERLLAIPGVMLSETQVRTYPLGEAAAHLVGYVQGISAEELEADEDNVYNSSSLVGKTGLESAFEERLRGTPGRRIRILSENGDTKKILAVSEPVDGEDITVTIDAALQEMLYEKYKADESASVALNPYSGEVLALVSTPSYDPNAFILGVSQEQWDAWNEDTSQPLLDRSRSVWAPGSTFKPVTAAIGLTAGLLDADEDYGSEGDSWQADAGWGSYHVTTLHSADPATIQNAITVSDNVFFARAALMIGADTLIEGWEKLGFGEEMPFALRLNASTYDNDGEITSDIQIADSGYGQGEIQVNPLHLASIYTAFLNQGNMVELCLEPSDGVGRVWKAGVFSEESCEVIREALRSVVKSESGTAHKAEMQDLPLAGKTGTAEVKSSQSDTDGTEIGWFVSYTAETDEKDTLMILSMVENAKEEGGSGYVVGKNQEIFESYWPLMEKTGEDEEADSEEGEDMEEADEDDADAAEDEGGAAEDEEEEDGNEEEA